MVVEFAVLIEASDHIFKPYPSIRLFGRFLICCISAVFFFVYIMPPLMRQGSSSVMMLELVKRGSLTKGVIILALLAAVRYFRLPLGRNVSGILLGSALYLATNMANAALAEYFGYGLYYRTFAVVLPLGYTLSLAVWTIALWRYEPALQVVRRTPGRPEEYPESLNYLFVRFNSALTRPLGKRQSPSFIRYSPWASLFWRHCWPIAIVGVYVPNLMSARTLRNAYLTRLA